MKICSDLDEQQGTMFTSHAMYSLPFVFGASQKTEKIGCHFILCTIPGNYAIQVLENHF